MARPHLVSQLRHARSNAEQLSVLREIKNEIIGHPLKKEEAVRQGLLEPVIRLSSNKQTGRQDGKALDHTSTSRPLTEEENIRLRGLHVLASVAFEGTPFLPRLQSLSVLPALFSNICPSYNPAQLVLASLRTLSNLTDSALLGPSGDGICIGTISEALFTRQHLASVSRILSQTSSSSVVQSQISTIASLISRLCFEERHQQAIAGSGVLDALATRLASFVVAEGLVIPGSEVLAEKDGLSEHLPAPAPPNANLPVILEAVAVIIADSKFRASQLIYSPSILAVFPTGQPTDWIARQHNRAAWNAFNEASLTGRQSPLNAIDYLLPLVPMSSLKVSNAHTSAFPALGTSNSREDLVKNGQASVNKHLSGAGWAEKSTQEATFLAHEPPIDAEDPESPLIAYLILVLRRNIGMERLTAAAVLTVLYRLGLTSSTRETSIGLLVVPLLVDLLDDTPIINTKDPFSEEEALELARNTREKAPAILAMLITDNGYLQKAAFDAGVISKLSALLKLAYRPVLESSNPGPWLPHPEEAEDSASDSSRFDRNKVLSPLLAHKIKVRESTLKAIASVVSFKDDYRKAIVDQGLIPFIVESMNSEPDKPTPIGSEKPERATNGAAEREVNHGYGINPRNVMIAACGAIRALSRSVSILRTTLIDNGISAPVISLLQNPDIEIQIASTATMCNLVTDISPMRDTILEQGVIRILCEHAHSTNARLRLNAVWALKHLVNAVPNHLKRLCVEELGQGWLVQLICDDTEDEALLSSREKFERRTGLSEGVDEDIEMDQFEETIDTAFASTSFNASTASRPTSSRSRSIWQAEQRLAALRDAETNPARKARKDDVAVQEQGLSFIRNLIGPTGSTANTEVTEMVDFLFNSLGQDRVFEILASKLRPKVLPSSNNASNRRSSPSSSSQTSSNTVITGTRILPPQPEIIISVCMILVHMAASIPRHRQIVISQTELLKLLVPQFHHQNVEIRIALCHLASNLSYIEDASDAVACRGRVGELVKVGVLGKLEMLEMDGELNVRERAKTAVYQIKQCLGY